ncbi:NAD-dependent protein deacylase [Enterococcus sp. LJL128]|uniref:NAD-dependent protein deacylase n=1 Tax=Enterococcus sp. LJL51 TaxID=3416656 RepID=UPI003CF29B5D
MKIISPEDGIQIMKESKAITFLTGAGVSTASGIPDYRSLSGVYQGIEAPEYLLSRSCLLREPEKFYDFVKRLYHPNAEPNRIHLAMADMEKQKEVWVVSQNIDGLHQKAGSRNRIDFHGNLYDCWCERCKQHVSAEQYLVNDRHEGCGGQLRPGIVLYEEGFDDQTISAAVKAVVAAELLVVVGTSFQVHPFCDLAAYARPDAKLLVINQTPVRLRGEYFYIETDAMNVFNKIEGK